MAEASMASDANSVTLAEHATSYRVRLFSLNSATGTWLAWLHRNVFRLSLSCLSNSSA